MDIYIKYWGKKIFFSLRDREIFRNLSSWYKKKKIKNNES